MAMIVRQELPPSDLEGISAFMLSDGAVDVPELSPIGTAVLDVITSNEPMMLKKIVVGRFVLHKVVDNETQLEIRLTAEGKTASHSDHLCDDEDGHTSTWGVVEEDYQDPEDAFLIGVPA